MELNSARTSDLLPADGTPSHPRLEARRLPPWVCPAGTLRCHDRMGDHGDPMSAGLFALLDDVAALARLAAASVDDIGAAAGRATAKAAGVVVDDTAVTPQYVHGIAAERELPIIKRIAIGSLRNKLLFILPAALLLIQFP